MSRKGDFHHSPPTWVGPFLAALKKTGLIGPSAKAAYTCTQNIWRYRKMHPELDRQVRAILAAWESRKYKQGRQVRAHRRLIARKASVKKKNCEFLLALKRTGEIVLSAELVGIHPDVMLQRRKKDPQLAEAVNNLRRSAKKKTASPPRRVNKNWPKIFLIALIQRRLIKSACAVAQISPPTYRKYKNTHPKFAALVEKYRLPDKEIHHRNKTALMQRGFALPGIQPYA